MIGWVAATCTGAKRDLKRGKELFNALDCVLAAGRRLQAQVKLLGSALPFFCVKSD